MLGARFVLRTISIGLMGLSASVYGQNYPNKLIRIVTGSVGGSSDVVARQIGPGISGQLGQPIIVENRPTGAIPNDIVAKASPDGYTLLVSGSSLWIGPLLQPLPYDGARDFSPITQVTGAPNLLVIQPSLPITSVKELIAYAKARPGQLNYAGGATGGPAHLAPELFKSMAGVNMVGIFYPGGAQNINAMLGGEVQVYFGSLALSMPHVKSGKFRALAVTSPQPSALAPGIPTMSSSGLPGYVMMSVDGVFAPAKTPAAIINRLNREIVRFVSMPEIKERFFNAGVEVVGSSPEQLAAFIKSDLATMGKVIKEAGIRAEQR